MKQGLALLAALAGVFVATPAWASGDERDTPSEPPASGVASDPVAVALASTIAGNPAARRPLARLRAPLCLVVAAQDSGFGEAVARRVIDNAVEAGVPVSKAGAPRGKAGCRANALVSFTEDARAQMQAIRDDGRTLFRRMKDHEIDAVLASRDPAYVFHAVEQTPRIGEGDAMVGAFGNAPETWTKERSALRAPEDLLTTLVVVEAGAIAGFPPKQVADYVTLRLLAPTAEVPADAAIAPRTILALFADPAAAPEEMTRTDRAYLRSLYTLPRTAFAAEVLEETARVAAAR